MFGYRIDFEQPWYLLLLLLIPALVWWSFGSLSGLGGVRRAIALGLRSLLVVLLACALAEVQVVRTTPKLTVIYLLDQSLSIPPLQRKAMTAYVNREIRRHRDRDREDRAGVIVFGTEAAIEIPPFEDDFNLPDRLESQIDLQHTNLAGALKLAQASFPEDAAKRVVVISDGNENIGSAAEEARSLTDAGIGIDVVPVRYAQQAEVAVEKVAIPPDVNRGQPFDLRVVLNNTSPADSPTHGISHGRLKVTRKTSSTEETLADQAVTLEPGKRVFSVREEINAPDFYTYEARFVPDSDADDAIAQNNTATAFTHVRGQGQVLLIENDETRGEFDVLIDRLRNQNLQVTLQSTKEMFTSLPQLQPFDTVLLGDVPREEFSDEQIKMLVRNTQQMGAGLIMLGGPNSFGAGGWTNTELEAAMPVDFQIKSAKVKAIGALAMLMHASELAQGNYWQKVIAKEAIKALGNEDYCGVIHWDGTEQWLWRDPESGASIMKVGGNREAIMLPRLDRMVPGDMPAFDLSLAKAAAEFAKLPDAAVKHMIIISDGDPSPPLPSTINALKQQRVKVSTVAVGTHGPAGSQPMQDIATATGGKYYVVNSPNALPKIYQQEARRVARPLVYEKPAGFQPQLAYPHEVTKGIEGPFPPITGFVLTQKKESPLVEVSILSPVPADAASSTILATWPYGLGKTAVFTTDAGHRWASEWTGWKDYDKLFSQLVRWSMRPAGDQGKFSVNTEIHDGKVRAVITALDKDDAFLNFLDMSGSVVGPDMKPLDIKIRQTAPGRYVGEFDSKDAGSYFMMINPGGGMMPVRAGVNVPYSPEFLDRETNESLLKTLAAMTPRGGAPGVVIDDPGGKNRIEKLLETNTFRHDLAPANSSQPIWHLLVVAAGCLFFCDVFNRRVSINLAWVPPLAAKLRDRVLRRQAVAGPDPYLERLRSRKAEVSEQIDQKRAAARFEPAPDADAGDRALEEQFDAAGPQAKPRAPDKPPSEPTPEGETYTDRLLKAKKKLWDQRDKP